MITRIIENKFRSSLTPDSVRKVICLFGPRQTGKTTLMQSVYKELEGRKDFLNGDFADDRALLVPERAALHRLAAHLDILFVDEAQNVPEIGRVLKLLHDTYPDLRIATSGSASFDLRRKTGEPLTGRQIVMELYPLSFSERAPAPSAQSVCLEESMIYGGYPEIVITPDPDEKAQSLKRLVADHLLKDIFASVDVNKDRLDDLLRLLAFQIGSEVSLNELAGSVRLDVKTVDRYLGLLEDAYILIRLGGFSRNLRKEVSKSRKIYFIDLGIRNALLQAFQPPTLRDDWGKLWENYLVIERHKRNTYMNRSPGRWFWRTYDQQEIDYIEEYGGKLLAAEFKWNPKRNLKFPKAWTDHYPEAENRLVTPANVRDFIT